MALLLLSVLLLLPLSSSTTTTTTIPLLLRHLPPTPSSPFTHLSSLATSSSLRASHLKHPKSHSPSTSPLSPHSYGGYSLPAAFGTPPQPLPLLLDTGSSLTWLPCTSSYRCTRCSSPSNPSPRIPTFIPKSSSSARLAGCRNPRCLWIHSPAILSRCRHSPAPNSTAAVCPPYAVLYGSGSTAGLLILDTLHLADLSVAGFAAGCSVYSNRQPEGGIAGFGRGAASVPSQLNLSSFAYCLISRRFDDNARATGALVLDLDAPSSTDGFRFTPFAANPGGNSSDNAFSNYYYVSLRRITVGYKKVKIPAAALAPASNGDGGVIVDSGTTFTYMSNAVFEPVARAFIDSVAGRYNRSAEAEALTGVRPCFTIPRGAAGVELPEMVLHFKGGAEMRLPAENYFVFAGSAACLAVISGDGGGEGGGPAVILGSFQQQNYYIVFDLKKGRLGFRQQSCLQD